MGQPPYEIHPLPTRLRSFILQHLTVQPPRFPSWATVAATRPTTQRWKAPAIETVSGDALCRAIATGHLYAGGKSQRMRFTLSTSGTEAMGEVTVQLEEGAAESSGRGASTDVIESSGESLYLWF